MTSLRTLRWIALAEGVTFLVLLGGLIARTAFDGPDLSGVIGPVHGIAVCAYAVGIVMAREERRWPATTVAVLLLAAIIPFGGAVVAHRVLRPHEDVMGGFGGAG